MQFRSLTHSHAWIWLKMNFHDTVYIKYEQNITIIGNGLEQIYYVAIDTQRFLWFAKEHTHINTVMQ